MHAPTLESHAWYDGTWHLYTERPADARRWTAWFGHAHTIGRHNGTPRSWRWHDLPANLLRVAKRHSRSKTPQGRGFSKGTKGGAGGDTPRTSEPRKTPC